MRLVLLISYLLLSSLISHAQSEKENNVPKLNNHYFIPVSNIQEPFIKTHFDMNLGIASSSNFENVILSIDGNTILGFKGSLIFANLKFDYQQKVKDWIAFYSSFGITARIGTELGSFLSQGVNTVSSFKLGWLIKLAEGDKYMLSGNVQLNNYSASFISVKGLITDIINDVPEPSISKNVPILNYGIGLRYAYAFNDIFGFKAIGGIGYGDTYTRGESDFIYRFSGMVDANLAERTKVPLGFAIYYDLNVLTELVQVAKKFSTTSGIKVSYTGGPHFNMGIELSRLRLPIPDVENKITGIAAVITTKYYFN